MKSANERRLKIDPEFREAKRETTRKWRRTTQKKISFESRGDYRSGMEARLVPPLLERGAQYEPLFLRYPAKERGYTPDVILPNGIAIEIKGWFTGADRSKMLAVKAAFPKLDIRMVLASPGQKLGRSSRTTQAMWCAQHGFPWAKDEVPVGWLDEPTNAASKEILDAAPRHKSKKKKT